MKTREKIVSSALNLFAERGYAATSIRQIAAEAGIRESSIYNHFRSKEEILIHLIKDYSRLNSEREILGEKLLDKLSEPVDFFVGLAEELIKRWSSPEEVKFMRIILSERSRNIGGFKISSSILFEETRKIVKLILTEMKKNKLIEGDVDFLTEEYLSPLFFIRLEKLNTPPFDKSVFDSARKHARFFWQNIKRR
ncbi:TetR/AcrR family transcriptional regulator [Melioribacter sp. Ez-97]|uniref:TetR/AcrR family transcriptional regulator n=1 Tax=Melioribacter sp. Ez-97 TaxID=3423434 RepID=UPI003EDA8B1E